MISIFNNSRFLAVSLADHDAGYALPGPICCLLPLDGSKPVMVGHAPVTVPRVMGMNECHHDNYSGSIAMLDLPLDSSGRYLVNGIPFRYLLIGRGHYDLSADYPPGIPGTRSLITVDILDEAIIVQYDTRIAPTNTTLGYVNICKDVWFVSNVDPTKRTYRFGHTSAWKHDSKGKEPYLPTPIPTTLSIRSFPASSILSTSETQHPLNSEILNLLDRRFLPAFPKMDEQLIWGDLSQQCCDNVKLLDINSLAYIGDLVELKNLVLDVLQLLKGKVNLKSMANLFLTVKYAIMTFIDDTKQIASIGQKLVKHQYMDCDTVRSRVSFTTIDPHSPSSLRWITRFNQKIFYLSEDVPFIEGIRLALTTGLFPSLSNVWDFIPFSFVVNWFVDLGSLFDRIDTHTLVSTLPIICACQTRMDRTVVSLASLPEMRTRNLQGIITYQRYRRDIVPSITPPRWRITPKEQGFDHWVESGALIIQKHKK